MKVEDIARVAHEVNRAYCDALGDSSQPGWDDAPLWQRDSARNGVQFHLNDDKSPEDSHRNWLQEKWDDGWVWGEEKNEKLKTHPCCVPFEKLPVEQKAKDFIFRAIVKELSE